MKNIKYIFISLFFFVHYKLFTQINIEAKLDTSIIKIGEQSTLTLKLSSSVTDTIIWPVFKDTIAGKIEIVKKNKIDTIIDSLDITKRILQQKLILTSFDSGYHPIPPIRFYIKKGKDDSTNYAESEALLLSVLTVKVDTTKEIKDIKAILKVPFSIKGWVKQYWQWIALGIIVLVLTILSYLYYKRKKSKVPEIKEKIIVKKLPHKEAMEKLTLLKEKKLWQQGKIKEYYSELSNIIREYIEKRFFIPALEQTTPEILYSIHRKLNDESYHKLSELLSLADIVKFAKEKPVASENEHYFNLAVDFVKITANKEESQID